MAVNDELNEERAEESVQTDRRGFFGNLKKWSAVVLGGIAFGATSTKQARAGWLNRRGGGGWLNGGGGGWVNRRGGGGWLNRR